MAFTCIIFRLLTAEELEAVLQLVASFALVDALSLQINDIILKAFRVNRFSKDRLNRHIFVMIGYMVNTKVLQSG